jgi:hypothetical protein
MLEDVRARAALVDFHRQWLELDRLDGVDRDADAYPFFTPSLAVSMHEQVRRFVETVAFDGEGTLAGLLTSGEAPIDVNLASLYAVEGPRDGWEEVTLDPDRRAGLTTLPGFLTVRAHAVHPSPVLRGVFVLDRLLCRPTGPPSVCTDTTPPSGEEAVTNRERYAQHTSDPECAVCHAAIDGIGFGFEAYDSLGAWRSEDGGVPVDDSGTVIGGDAEGPFQGAVELAWRLSASADVHRCYARRWFSYSEGRRDAAGDAAAVDRITADFAAADGDLIELLVAVVVDEGFALRWSEAGSEGPP